MMLVRTLLFIAQFFVLVILNNTVVANERIQANDLTQASASRSVGLMSTTVEFNILLPPSEPSALAHQAINNAINEIERITAVFSEWEPTSRISEINNKAGKHAVNVEPEVFRLISEALYISELSQGKFDITFKSAGKLWDFRQQLIPDSDALLNAVSAINYKNVELNESKQTIYLKNEQTQIGLGGIAKGYAIDRAAQVIRKAGFEVFYINAGGDLYASSGSQSKRWKVGVQDPDDSNELIALIPIANAAVATSGDYERYFEKDGIRYHHIIDPATGQPARLARSVTIISARAYLADALATAVFVLGPKNGMALIEELEGVEAIIVGADGQHANSM
jgi:thiamine biosynthesis lipoprotein